MDDEQECEPRSEDDTLYPCKRIRVAMKVKLTLKKGVFTKFCIRNIKNLKSCDTPRNFDVIPGRRDTPFGDLCTFDLNI